MLSFAVKGNHPRKIFILPTKTLKEKTVGTKILYENFTICHSHSRTFFDQSNNIFEFTQNGTHSFKRVNKN